MTKILLPEEIIEYILSFAPDYRDNLKKCQSELLENKPIYYSTWEVRVDSGSHAMMLGCGITIEDVLDTLLNQPQVKYINGLGRRVIWPRSIEISPLHRYVDPTLHPFRIVKINYGWGREKDHESWKAILKGEAGRKNLTTGYY